MDDGSNVSAVPSGEFVNTNVRASVTGKLFATKAFLGLYAGYDMRSNTTAPAHVSSELRHDDAALEMDQSHCMPTLCVM